MQFVCLNQSILEAMLVLKGLNCKIKRLADENDDFRTNSWFHSILQKLYCKAAEAKEHDVGQGRGGQRQHNSKLNWLQDYVKALK